MSKKCPYCSNVSDPSDIQPTTKRDGSFRRKSDARIIQRFRCLRCLRGLSNSTTHPCRNQNKRQINDRLRKLLASNVCMRRCAKLLNVSRTTVARKLEFLGAQARLKLEESNASHPLAENIQFDDMETFEHTKCKPLSITLAVETRTRRILGFRVSQMPANGKLAARSVKKYGKRKDHRTQGRSELFEDLQKLVSPTALIKSDQNPHYVSTVKKYFPRATHEGHKGQRGSVVGQGELKKVRFDPLFSLNHTCAMNRANVCRLIRKTWNTTKLRRRLADHLAIYAVYHNLTLLPQN